MMDVNVKGYLFLSRMAMPYMEKAGGGSIINIASVEGFRPSYGTGLYSVTKAAVVMLTKVLALEWAAKKITGQLYRPGAGQDAFFRVPLEERGDTQDLPGALPDTSGSARPTRSRDWRSSWPRSLPATRTGSVFTADGGYLI